MSIPTPKAAEGLLEESSKLNPGRWVTHSRYAAAAARNIAEKHPDLNADHAYVFGLLHDIGRRAGMTHMSHILVGYNYLTGLGYHDAARICLTHSFPYKNTSAAAAKWDCTDEERSFVDNYIYSTEYNTYDRLIQLCDFLALHSGFCLIEKRMIDISMRHGTNSFSVHKWKSIFTVKEEMERHIGCSIYDLLPGVVENTLMTNINE